MSSLIPLTARLRASAPRKFALAMILTLALPLMGMSLMGLSGWFIAASAAAGLAGAGLVFDFLRPSAVIRLLTLGRGAARYGERLAGHDATLRALQDLRAEVFAGLRAMPLPGLARLHSARELNRLTADIDAVEGLLIRLVFPAVAACGAVLIGSLALMLLAGPAVAGGFAALMTAGLFLLWRIGADRARAAAAAHETALQEIRALGSEAITLRTELLFQGRMRPGLERLSGAIRAAEEARAGQDLAERLATVVVAATPAVAAGLVMMLAPGLDIARLLASILIVLAMAEPLRMVWRGLAERGRIELAAARLTPVAVGPAQGVMAETLPKSMPTPRPGAGPCAVAGPASGRVIPNCAPGTAGIATPADSCPLEMRDLTAARPGGTIPLFEPISLRLEPGQALGLAAPSGAGKSTLLSVLARLMPPLSGQLLIDGLSLDDWPEDDLRDRMVLVPQRPALIAGSVTDNLWLAAPHAGADHMRAALDAVALMSALDRRAGLETRLGQGGAGLSGGEARRLALARALVRRPRLLLLDEPTEGLDAATAKAVLTGIRKALPEAALVIVSHRAEDLADLDRVLMLVPAPLSSFRPQSKDSALWN